MEDINKNGGDAAEGKAIETPHNNGKHVIEFNDKYMDEMPKKNENNCCKALFVNLGLLWDGIGFFGPGHHKLARLEGVKVRWWQRCLQPGEMIMLILWVGAIGYII